MEIYTQSERALKRHEIGCDIAYTVLQSIFTFSDKKKCSSCDCTTNVKSNLKRHGKYFFGASLF